jgi:hypothetical protein
MPEATIELLSPAEFKAMDLTVELFNHVVTSVIGNGITAKADTIEFVAMIHNIQRMILSQAACRAYPDQFRLLGSKIQH